MFRPSLFGGAAAVVMLMGSSNFMEAGGPSHHGGHHHHQHHGHAPHHGHARPYPSAAYFGAYPRPVAYQPYVPAPVVIPAYPQVYQPSYVPGCATPAYGYPPAYGYRRPSSGFGIRTDDFSLWLSR